MLLSIVIPVYNASKYLHRSVSSILKQGLKEEEFEVLFVNDGSTDDSQRIIEAYCSIYKNMRYVSKSNEGVSRTRNIGVQEAVGEYVYMMDADDYIVEGGLRIIVDNYLRRDIDVVKFGATTVDGYYSADLEQLARGGVEFLGKGRDSLESDSMCINTAVWNLIIRRSFILDNGIIHTPGIIFSEDLLFNIDLLFANPNMVIVTDNIYRYIVIQGTATTSIDYQHLRRVIDSIFQVLLRVSRYNKTCDNIRVANHLAHVIQSQYIKLYSRFLSSDLSSLEIRTYLRMMKEDGLPEPTHRVLRMLYKYPILIKLFGIPYRHIFMRYIHPKLKRN